MTDTQQEQVKISDAVIAICAVNATRRTDGVDEMAGGFADMLGKSLLGIDFAAKGVKVSENSIMTASSTAAIRFIQPPPSE